MSPESTVLRPCRAIALPPAYIKAWYCPFPNGHIQATGVDARGRKQYRYHPDFRARQEAAKYERLAAFGARDRNFAGASRIGCARWGGSCRTTSSGWTKPAAISTRRRR